MARSSRRGKLLLLGAAVVAAGVFFKRDKVAGLLPGRGQTYEPPPRRRPARPTTTPPGPWPTRPRRCRRPSLSSREPIDEAAEEAAAAAEAANIGGSVSDYAGPSDLPATEAERPVAEAGGGEAEGQEQAELDLREAAEPDRSRHVGQRASDRRGDRPGREPAGRRAARGRPARRRPARRRGGGPALRDAARRGAGRDEPADATERAVGLEPAGAGALRRAGAVRRVTPEEGGGEPTEFEPPTQEQPAAPGEEEKPKDEEGGSDWRTWSGRSVNP